MRGRGRLNEKCAIFRKIVDLYLNYCSQNFCCPVRVCEFMKLKPFKIFKLYFHFGVLFDCYKNLLQRVNSLNNVFIFLLPLD